MGLKDRLASLTSPPAQGRPGAPREAQAAPLADPQDAAGFDAAFYLRAYPDVRSAGLDPLQHYLSSGWRESRDPAPDFDTVFYRMAVSGGTHPDLCPLVHYNRFGAAQGAPRTRAEMLSRGGYTPPAEDLIAALPDLATHFDAALYADRYPAVVGEGQTALQHYLTEGWRAGFSPSATFDGAFYRETFQAGDASDICPLVHYLLYGRHALLPTTWDEARSRQRAIQSGKAASDPALAALAGLGRETVAALCLPHFDAAFYHARNPDVAKAGMPALWHYLNSGWREGRDPSASLESDWYANRHIAASERAQINPLLHYAVFGRMSRLPSAQRMTMSQAERLSDSVFSDQLRHLLGRLGFDVGLLDFDRVRRFVLPMFSADSVRRRHALSADVSDVDCLLRYLVVDLPAGVPPGPMFSASHYLSALRDKGIAPPKPWEQPFHHWLAHGESAGISPTPGFDGEEYLALNPDLADYPESMFDHFIRHGQFEGRQFNRLTMVASSRLAALSGDATSAARRFCDSVSASGDEEGGLAGMRAFLTSGRLEQTIREAAAIEPDVGGLDRNMPGFLPPWHDAAWAEYSQILRLLPEGPFDAVVLMPFCKLGGADFVAGVLAQTLATTDRVLVLRTDADDWARPDWFPASAATVDLSAQFNAMNPPTRMRMLYELLVRIRPSAVYNVNSRLAFDTFVRYGERLALVTRLHAYYFCADRTAEGHEAGYPVWYFSNILPALTAALIDNRALAEQLIRRYSLTGPFRDRVRLIYTPAMTPPPAAPVVEDQIASAARRSKPRILWAGRLDAQKRFDLVQDIARLLPDIDFDCWGKAVLDAPPDLSRLPSNLRLHPPFRSFSDLPLADSDGWLYTSAWDGMPTILIELAALGVPMVASAVGGVPELVDSTTGWPLGEAATARDYAAALTEMLASPEDRRARAAALQDRARRQHSRESFAAALSATPATSAAPGGTP